MPVISRNPYGHTSAGWQQTAYRLAAVSIGIVVTIFVTGPGSGFPAQEQNFTQRGFVQCELAPIRVSESERKKRRPHQSAALSLSSRKKFQTPLHHPRGRNRSRDSEEPL